jgi:2-polyprenyl-6-methoxyphenol hydroxylase-like FAD-dependent oxidoreductase
MRSLGTFLSIVIPSITAFSIPKGTGNNDPPVSSSLVGYCDCAIIGAGPAGLATAIAISKSSPSSSIAIFDRDGFQPKGASIQISKPGWESIENLDSSLVNKLKKTGVPVTSVEFKPMDVTKSNDDSNEGIKGVIMSRFVLKAVSFFYRILRRAITYVHLWHDVRSVLADHAKEVYSATNSKEGSSSDALIELNCNLESIQPLSNPTNNEDGPRFEITFENQEKKLHAKYVFACDGTNSRVRSLLPDEPDILLSENKSVWRGVAPNVQSFGKAIFYRGANDGRSALVFPGGKDAGSSWTVISNAKPGKSQTREEARERLLAVTTGCDDILKRAIGDSPIIIENKLQVRDFELPWESSYDGLVYIGDAAHPVRPTGEGTALAFEDAKVLGDMVAKHGLCVEALRLYEDARYEPVKEISEKVRAAAQSFYSRSIDSF